MGGRGDGSFKWYVNRNKYEGRLNIKMNILIGIKMNIIFILNRVKFLNNM